MLNEMSTVSHSPISGGLVDTMASQTVVQMQWTPGQSSPEPLDRMVRETIKKWAHSETNETLRRVLLEHGIAEIVDDVVGGTRILSTLAYAMLYEPTRRRVMQHCSIFDMTSAPKSLGQCDICQKDDDELTELPCKHRFGTTCLSVWFELHRTCPMCRAEVTM